MSPTTSTASTLWADQQSWQEAADGSGRLRNGVSPEGRTTIPENRMSRVPAKEPPTQGHHYDMGTSPNTAAIYVRRSAFDADNTEAKRQKAAQAEARRRG